MPALPTDGLTLQYLATKQGLQDHYDVNGAAPAQGDVLMWDDSANAWVPAQISGGAGGGALTDLSDVTITTPSTGQYLRKSAGDWVNSALLHSDVTFTGLTAGHVWRASGATAASFAALQASDLPTHTHGAGDITSGTLSVTRGGTGVSDPTTGNLLVGAGASAMTLLAPGAAGGYVRSNASAWVRVSGIAHTDVTFTGLTAGHVWRASGAAAASFAALQSGDLPTHTHGAGDITSGTLSVTRGGTGVSDPTTGNLLVGAGASAMTALAPGAAGGYVRSNGTTWVRVSGVAHTDLTYSGLTAGTFLRASGASAASFAVIQAADLPIHTHGADEITSGTFASGNYVFPSLLDVEVALRILTGRATTAPAEPMELYYDTTLTAMVITGLDATTARGWLFRNKVGAGAETTRFAISGTGAVTTGSWTGSVISATYGGTGLADPANGNLIVGSGGGTMTALAPGAAGGYVRSNASAWVRNSGVPHGDLTFSGLTATHVLRASGASSAAFAAIVYTDITYSGLTAGQVWRASGTTSATFSSLLHTDVTFSGLTAGHHWRATASNAASFQAFPHTDVTFTGLTAGHVWRASGASAASFAALQAGDLPTHTHAETDITNGTLLARVGDNETITGAWTFSALLTHSAALSVGVAIVNTTASGAGEGGGLRISSNDGAANVSGDRLGGIYFAGYTTAPNEVAATISAFAEGTWSVSSAPASLRFATTASGSLSETERWRITQDGHFFAGADNAYDIGATSTTRPRTGYFGTSLNVGNGRATVTVPAGDGTVFVSDGTATGQLYATGLRVYVGSNTAHDFGLITNGVERWKITQSTGHLLAATDNTHDIGAVTATRPRTIYVGTSLVIPNSAAGSLLGRNAANSANLVLFGLDSGNNLNIGRDDGIGQIQMFGPTVWYDDAATPALFFEVTEAAIIMKNDRYLWGRDSSGTAVRLIGIASGNTVYIGSLDASAGTGDIIFRTDGVDRLELLGAGLYPSAGANLALGDASFPWTDITARNLVLLGAGSGEVNGSIEMGRQDGTASTPFIDFHTSTSLVDYNVRFQAAGSAAGLGAGQLTLLASAGFVIGASDPGGNALLRVKGDVRIDALGVINSAIAPTADQLLGYDSASAKWIPRTVQLTFNSGVMVASALGDGSQWVGANSNPTPPADPGTNPGAPGTPTVTAVYGGFIIDMGTTPPANMTYVIDYSKNAGAYTTNAIVCTSQKVVHQIIQNNAGGGAGTSTDTFAYKVKIRYSVSNYTAYSTASSGISFSTQTQVNAYGLLIASQIACVNLAAIVADLGIITAGRIQNAANDVGIRVSSGYSLPATWKTYLDLVDGSFVVTDDQGSPGPYMRVRIGQVGSGTSDYGLQVWDANGDTIMDFTGAKRILAVPVTASVDSGASITVDLSTGLTQQVRLTASAPTITLTNPVNGARYRIWFQQDTTGSRLWPTSIGGPNGEIVMYTNDLPPTLTTTPGALDLFEFEYREIPSTRFTCMTLQQNVLLPTPQVQGTPATQTFASSTTHNVTMPATVNAGDLLLVVIVFSGSTANTPSGWTAGTNGGFAGGGNMNVFYKTADGSEDSTNVNFSTVAAATGASVCYRITRCAGSIAGSFATGSNSATVDPPSVTPGWTVDRTLWIAVGGQVSGNTVASPPTNYTNMVQAQSSCAIVSARRVLYATAENPGAFTFSGSASWGAITVAVRPPL